MDKIIETDRIIKTDRITFASAQSEWSRTNRNPCDSGDIAEKPLHITTILKLESPNPTVSKPLSKYSITESKNFFNIVMMTETSIKTISYRSTGIKWYYYTENNVRKKCISIRFPTFRKYCSKKTIYRDKKVRIDAIRKYFNHNDNGWKLMTKQYMVDNQLKSDLHKSLNYSDQFYYHKSW